MFDLFKKKKSLHPDFPVAEGQYKITSEWSVTLPTPFNRRFEENQLILWQPGVTAWIIVWDNARGEEITVRLDALKRRHAPDAFSEKETRRNDVTYYTYRLRESAEDNRVAALCCYAFSDTGHVQMSIYFDKESDIAVAESLCYSLQYEAEKP